MAANPTLIPPLSFRSNHVPFSLVHESEVPPGRRAWRVFLFLPPGAAFSLSPPTPHPDFSCYVALMPAEVTVPLKIPIK